MPEVVRMCQVCRGRFPKKDLRRWVRTGDGLEPDPQQKLPGRGLYTHSEECQQKLLSHKKGRHERSH